MGDFLFRNAARVPHAPRAGSPSFTLGGRGGDRTEQLEQMGAVGTLFMIVHRLSSAVAQTEWKLYRKKSDRRQRYGPGTDTRVEILPGQHAALDLWNRPNPFMTQSRFVHAFEQHIELTGECEWFVARSEFADFPFELWPVRPDRIQPVPDPQRFLAGWVYRAPGGEQVPLGTEDIIQLQMPNPTTLYRGLSPVAAVMSDLGATQAAAAYNDAFFRNGAAPGGVITHPDAVDDTQYRTLLERWREQHQGVRNAHRVALLDGGVDWKSVSYSMKDMLFPELRNMSREVIREAFGFPKPMTGAVDDVNRANAEAGEYVFARWLLVERLDRIKDALNTHLLPMFGSTGENVEFDYSDPVPEDLDREAADRTSKTSAFATLVNAGVDPKDAAVVCGLPEMAMVKGGNSEAEPALA